MSAVKRIILDVDTASGSVGGESDDALAILLALQSPEIRIEGITTGPGNVDTGSATVNTLRILEMADRKDIPVAEGRFDRLLGDGEAIRRHYDLRHTKPPASAYWADWKVPPPPRQKAAPEKAYEFIISTIRRYPGEVTLVFVGSLINLAVAIAADPGIVPLIKGLVHMGGFFDLSHFLRVTDRPANGWLNTDYDPVASTMVFRSGLKITQIPVDATTQTTITVEEFQEIVKHGSSVAAFVAKSAIPWTKYIMNTRGYSGSCPHDALAVAFVIDPTLVETRPKRVHIERLLLQWFPYFEDNGNGPLVDGAVKVDVVRFKKMLMDRYLQKGA